MTYRKGDAFISIQKIDVCGKKLGLWIGTQDKNRSEIVKVATFSNDDTAKTFQKWLEYFLFGERIEVEAHEWWED